MKDMISASKYPGFLYGKLVPRSFNDTDGPIGAAFVSTDWAGVIIGQVKTNRAELDPLFDL